RCSRPAHSLFELRSDMFAPEHAGFELRRTVFTPEQNEFRLRRGMSAGRSGPRRSLATPSRYPGWNAGEKLIPAKVFAWGFQIPPKTARHLHRVRIGHAWALATSFRQPVRGCDENAGGFR